MLAQINQLQKRIEKIPGYLLNDEGRLLYDLAQNCPAGTVIVEIGSWEGRSTSWLAFGSKAGKRVKVYAVDPHLGSPEHQKLFGKVNTLEKFKKNIQDFGLKELVIPVVKTSAQAAQKFNYKVGLVFIDGDHSYQMVKKDYQLWFPKLIEGGTIAFHDTTGFRGVRKVVRIAIFKSNKINKIGFISSITFGRKVKKTSLSDKIRNCYLLAIHEIYSSFAFAQNYLPTSLINFGKKLARLLQFNNLFLN